MALKQQLSVEGMHCSSCGMLIDDALEDLPGVTSSATNVRRKRCVVEYDPEAVAVNDIVSAIEELGYRVSLG